MMEHTLIVKLRRKKILKCTHTPLKLVLKDTMETLQTYNNV